MFKTLTLIVISLVLNIGLLAQTRSFQSARLISTAGTGAASISLLDSAVLNPAAIAFFKESEFSYQQNRTTYDTLGVKEKFTNHGIIIGDAKSEYKGTVSYFDTEDKNFEQKAYGLTFGKQVSKLSALGLGYQYKTINNKLTGEKDKRHIVTLGNNFIYSKNIAVGVVVMDPFDSDSYEHRVILGVQAQLASTVYLLVDGLSNQKFKDFNDTLGWRAALQIKVFDKVFLRAGHSEDKRDNLKENGYGIDIRLEKFQISAGFRTSQILDPALASFLPANTKSSDFIVKGSVRF